MRTKRMHVRQQYRKSNKHPTPSEMIASLFHQWLAKNVNHHQATRQHGVLLTAHAVPYTVALTLQFPACPGREKPSHSHEFLLEPVDISFILGAFLLSFIQKPLNAP